MASRSCNFCEINVFEATGRTAAKIQVRFAIFLGSPSSKIGEIAKIDRKWTAFSQPPGRELHPKPSDPGDFCSDRLVSGPKSLIFRVLERLPSLWRHGAAISVKSMFSKPPSFRSVNFQSALSKAQICQWNTYNFTRLDTFFGAFQEVN